MFTSAPLPAAPFLEEELDELEELEVDEEDEEVVVAGAAVHL